MSTHSLRPLILVAIASIISLLSLRLPLEDYTLTVWVSLSADEWVKRSLLPMLLQFITTPLQQNIQWATLLLYSISCIAITALAIVVTNSTDNGQATKSSKGPLLLGLLLLLVPGSIQQFGYDLGRFDQVGYVLLIASLLCGYFKPITLAFLLPVFSLIGILNHEAFIVMQWPCMMVILYLSQTTQVEKWLSAIASIIALITGALLTLLAGDISNQPIETYMASLAKHSDFSINRSAVDTLYWGLATSIRLTYDWLSFKSVKHLLMITVINLPIWWLIVVAYREVWRQTPVEDRLQWRLAVLAPLCVLLLFVVGIDIARWYGAIQLNLLLMLITLTLLNNQCTLLPQLLAHRYKMTLAALVSALYCGPAGVTSPLPYRAQLFKSAGQWFGG